jgi:hypothetical protein
MADITSTVFVCVCFFLISLFVTHHFGPFIEFVVVDGFVLQD